MRTVKLLFATLLAAVAAVVVPLALEEPQPAAAWENGLARTPPMGWNNWNSFGCGVNETLVKETVDVMVADGWRDAGYEYVNVDDCWSTKSRNAAGNLVADPVKFPSGMKALADYVHARGMKFGIYADAGTMTCAEYPGSYGHERVDAALFASWGVDYIKYDNCYKPANVTAESRYRAMRDAIIATGRPMALSLCNWGQESPWNWGPSVGNLWRTTGDITPNWSVVMSIFDKNVPLAFAAKPGAWNDPDMLEVGAKLSSGDTGLTYDEARSHFSLWAIMAAPLIAGADLRTLPANMKAIYLNREVIAINQDPLGEQARTTYADAGETILVKPLANGDRVVALFNRSGTAQSVSTTANYMGMPVSSGYTVTDLWTGQVTTTTGAIGRTVKPHETVLLRVKADTPGQSGWTRSLVGKQSGKCLDDPDSSTANGTQVVIWGGCHGGVNEQWTYTSSKQLQVMGKCLDAAPNAAAGTRLQLWDCNGGANQRWTVG